MKTIKRRTNIDYIKLVLALFFFSSIFGHSVERRLTHSVDRRSTTRSDGKIPKIIPPSRYTATM